MILAYSPTHEHGWVLSRLGQTHARGIMAETYLRQLESAYGSPVDQAPHSSNRNDEMVRTAGQLGQSQQRRPPRTSTPSIEKAAHLLGRAVFGGYFLYNGVNHFLNHKMMSDYTRSKGVAAPEAAVAVSGLMLLAGGASIVLGIKPKFGAGLVSAFLVAVSPQMHAFWKETEPQQRMNDMVNFTKNVALLGAAFLAAAHPEPWPWRAAAARST